MRALDGRPGRDHTHCPIANVRSCDKRWCAVVIGDFKGYLEQNKLWGVYPGEIVK